MSLEDKVEDKESNGFIKKAFKLGFLGAATVGSTLLGLATAGISAPIIGGALAAGGIAGGIKKGKKLYEIVKKAMTDYSAVNIVLNPMVKLGEATYPVFGYLGSKIAGGIGSIISKSLYALTAYNAAFVGLFRGAEHLLDNYLNPRGLANTVKTNFYNGWKRIGQVFAPGYILTANGIHDIFGINTFAANALPAGYINTAYPVAQAKGNTSHYKKAA